MKNSHVVVFKTEINELGQIEESANSLSYSEALKNVPKRTLIQKLDMYVRNLRYPKEYQRSLSQILALR